MLEDQQYVVAIAQYGSISKAARAVHMSQPGLSQRLKKLEQELGCELFDRTSSKLTLTSAGEVYLRYALRAIASEETMRRDVYEVANLKRQRLRVAVSMPRANSLLAQPVMSFYESHQGCTLEFVELEDLDVLHNLFLTEAVDFALLAPVTLDTSTYYVESLMKERPVLAASRNLNAPQLLRAKKTKRVRLAELEGLPFVLPTCSRYLDPLIERYVDSSGARLDIAVRGCSTDMAVDLVRSGLGVAIVPSTSLICKKDVVAYELEDMVVEIDLNYIRHHYRDVYDEERLFIDIFKEWLGTAAV